MNDNAILKPACFEVIIIFRVHAPFASSRERVWLLGSLPELGEWNPARAIETGQVEGEWKVWQAWVRLPMNTSFQWSWCTLSVEGHLNQWESSQKRERRIFSFSGVLHTSWGDPTVEIFQQNMGSAQLVTQRRTKKGDVVAVVGSSPALGSWDPAKAVLASEFPPRSGYWAVTVYYDSAAMLEWNWIIIDKETKQVKLKEKLKTRFLYESHGWIKLNAPWNKEAQAVDWTHKEHCGMGDPQMGTVELINIRRARHHEIRRWEEKAEMWRTAGSKRVGVTATLQLECPIPPRMLPSPRLKESPSFNTEWIESHKPDTLRGPKTPPPQKALLPAMADDFKPVLRIKPYADGTPSSDTARKTIQPPFTPSSPRATDSSVSKTPPSPPKTPQTPPPFLQQTLPTSSRQIPLSASKPPPSPVQKQQTPPQSRPPSYVQASPQQPQQLAPKPPPSPQQAPQKPAPTPQQAPPRPAPSPQQAAVPGQKMAAPSPQPAAAKDAAQPAPSPEQQPKAEKQDASVSTYLRAKTMVDTPSTGAAVAASRDVKEPELRSGPYRPVPPEDLQSSVQAGRRAASEALKQNKHIMPVQPLGNVEAQQKTPSQQATGSLKSPAPGTQAAVVADSSSRSLTQKTVTISTSPAKPPSADTSRDSVRSIPAPVDISKVGYTLDPQCPVKGKGDRPNLVSDPGRPGFTKQPDSSPTTHPESPMLNHDRASYVSRPGETQPLGELPLPVTASFNSPPVRRMKDAEMEGSRRTSDSTLNVPDESNTSLASQVGILGAMCDQAKANPSLEDLRILNEQREQARTTGRIKEIFDREERNRSKFEENKQREMQQLVSIRKSTARKKDQSTGTQSK